MWNIGLSWIPQGALEGLSFDIDYYDYDYKDLISREGHQALIDADNLNRCPNGTNDDPAAGPLCGTSDQDGDGVDEVYTIGPGLTDKVIRRDDGGLLRTQAEYFNAPSLKTTGIDFNLAYQFDTGIGTWRFGILGSHTLKYDIIDDQGNEIDGVGSRNAGNSIGRPLPPWKVNGTISWFKDRHSALATIRYIDSYDDDVPQSALRGAFGFENETIESWTSLDLQYNFQIGQWGGAVQDSVITIGLKNATNEEPPIVNVDGGYDYFTHDPRGRIVYGRFRVTL
jgi:iron complex outermembrane receptor protein